MWDTKQLIDGSPLKEQLSAEDITNSDKVFQVFANSFEKSSSHWQARDEYLGDIKQGKQQTSAELDIYIKDLVRRCQFKTLEQEARKIDILYHATAHFEVRKFVHNAKPNELTYDRMIEVAKAHERTCHEYQQHKQAHSGPVSNYQNPLIQANALTKSFQRKKLCGKCGRTHNLGDCPAFGQKCHSCGRKNHWTALCRSRRNSSSARPPSPHKHQNRQRRPSGNKQQRQGGGGAKGGGNKFFKKGGTPRKKQGGANKTYSTLVLQVVQGGNSVSTEESFIAGPPHPPKEKYSLPGPPHPPEEKYSPGKCSLPGPPHPPEEKYSPINETDEVRSNPFTCYALGNGNRKPIDDCNVKYKVYTDTDSDGKTEIITDINCKHSGKSFAMEVKVDPGSETNCIPLSHFRRLFPQLCRSDGLPKETTLTPTLAQFEAYNSGVMRAHVWIVVSSQSISDYKFHPVRYYVVDREEARILISHATATWLGLVKVLCTNKAPKCKRQVA